MSTTTNNPKQPIPTMSDSSTEEEPTTVKSSSDPRTSTPDPAESSTGGTPPADQQDESQQETTETETTEDQESPNKEAAKYRVRLREAEAERDDLAAKLEAVTDNVLADKLAHTGVPVRLLRRVGVDLNSVYADDGTFSDEALLGIVNDTLNELDIKPSSLLDSINHTHQRTGKIDWSRTTGAGYVPSAGTGGEHVLTGGEGWEGLLKNAK